MDEQRGNGSLWALVGCGALLFVGLCVALGAGVYLVMKRQTAGPPLGQSPPAPPVATPSFPPPVTPIVPDKPPPGAPATDPVVAIPPIEFQATVTNVTGALSSRVSRGCRFVVEAPQANGSCRTQITCDSILVYGGPSAGYFPCRFDPTQRSVSGADTNTTSDDSDAAMTVDTTARTLQIRDDATGPNGAFTITATLSTSL